MKLVLQIACLLAFAIGLFVFFVSIVDWRESDLPQWEFTLVWLTQGTGFFVAAVAALALLLKAIGGASLQELSRMVLPLLAGVVLIQPHWSAIVSLGVIAIGFVAKEFVRTVRAGTEDPK
jgi:hypothetical protein